MKFRLGKLRILCLILVISISFNIVFFYLDLLPSIIYKLDEPQYVSNLKVVRIEKLVVKSAYEMFTSEKLRMLWAEHPNLIGKLKALNIERDTKIYNYPKAFLALGLISYSAEYDTLLLRKVALQFDEYYVSEEGLKFDFKFVDQAVLGLAAMELYKVYGSPKYKRASDEIFEKLVAMIRYSANHYIILYRDGSEMLLVDAIGMVCPFLMKYGKLFDNDKATRLAKSQLQFFIEFGIDKETHLPFHVVNLNNLQGLGPNNWGRGLGWYMQGLNSLVNDISIEDSHYNQFKAEASFFVNSIKSPKNEQIYTQFPGTSKRFDSSTTTVLLYGENMLSS